jgi:hypothetical protein
MRLSLRAERNQVPPYPLLRHLWMVPKNLRDKAIEPAGRAGALLGGSVLFLLRCRIQQLRNYQGEAAACLRLRQLREKQLRERCDQLVIFLPPRRVGIGSEKMASDSARSSRRRFGLNGSGIFCCTSVFIKPERAAADLIKIA